MIDLRSRVLDEIKKIGIMDEPFLPFDEILIIQQKKSNVLDRCIVNSLIVDGLLGDKNKSSSQLLNFFIDYKLKYILSNIEVNDLKSGKLSKNKYSWYRFGNIPLMYIIGLINNLNIQMIDEEIILVERKLFEKYGSLKNIYDVLEFRSIGEIQYVFMLYYYLFRYCREYPEQKIIRRDIVYEGFRAISWVFSNSDYDNIDTST